MEVEISKDSTSFMLWVRVPKRSFFVAPVLRFLNSVGGAGLVKGADEKEILKDMRDCCYEVSHEAYKRSLK